MPKIFTVSLLFHILFLWLGATHVKDIPAGVLDHCGQLPLSVLHVALGHPVALQHRCHIVMHCIANLLSHVSHATPVLGQEG